MADFRLGRLKFNWRGAWAPSTAYVIDDIISFKGNTYVCVVNHTSAASETIWAVTDLEIATPRWQLHVPGVRIMGAWTSNTFYAKNDLVSYGSAQYLCVVNHTSAASQENFYSTDISNWSLYTQSFEYKGEWQPGIWYKLNDIVKYGNNQYICDLAHTSGISFDETKFDVFSESIKFEDTWNNAIEYQPGDIVAFGGYSYVAKQIHTGKQPNIYNVETLDQDLDPVPAYWEIVTTGFDVKGEYNDATIYVPGDVVQFGGNSYVKIATTAAGVYPIDTAAWSLVSSGLNWRGPWSDIATYQVNDVVSKQSASWVNLTAHNINIDPVADQSNGALNWQAVAQGESTLTLQNPGDILYRNAGGANVNLPIGNDGEILTVDSEGLPAWERNNLCANVYYVTTDGVDDSTYGRNISKPWRTLKYALSQIPTGTADSINTIFVKSGSYEEQLPLVVPSYTSIVGDNLRATIIKPKTTGLSTDAVPVENRFSTMFVLSESTTLKDLVFVGMEGFTPAGGVDASDITQATIRGVFLRLNPNTPILGKSPYITQCSAFSGRPLGTAANCTGGVGALVDKSIYGATNSNGSMLFDSFTQFHDLGVGFWCKDLGNAEVVSCFTYYCHIGYTCTGGGRIRSLAGNNSWGTYGAVSAGFDTSEVPVTGNVRGQRLNFIYDENSALFKQYEEVVQGTDPGNGDPIDYSTTNTNYARALILYVQSDYLIIEPITGTFTTSKPIKGDGSATVVASDATGDTAAGGATPALEGIKGKIYPLTNLPVVGGVAQLPKITGATKFNNVVGAPQYNDNGYYVIKEVVDASTANNLFLTTLRRYDVPGTAPVGYDIVSLSRTSGVSTVTTSAPHGLSNGDKVTIVIANTSPTIKPYATGYDAADGIVLGIRTGILQRSTVTVTGGSTFTYANTGGDNAIGAGDALLTGAKVYKQNTTGGSTLGSGGSNNIHLGGTSVTLYNVSSSTALLNASGVAGIDDSTESADKVGTATYTIPFADESAGLLSANGGEISAGANNFILMNNEIMRIDSVTTAGVVVVRAQEGTTIAPHADGSVIYYMTKVADTTTLRGDIDTAITDIPLFSISGFDTNDIVKVNDEFMRITSVNSPQVGRATIIFAQPKSINANNNQAVEIRLRYSQVRLTGHDFLQIGTGSKLATNWPNTPTQDIIQANEVIEDFPGRVYYVSTDQDGNFRVGEFFTVEQATGTATLDASAFNLSGLASLRLGTLGAELGVAINEFSGDTTLGGDFSRDGAVPTQLAVKTYVDNSVGAGVLRTAPIINVSTLTSSGTTATVTSFTANNVYVGDAVVVQGADQANYNGTFTVQQIDTASKSFTYIMGGTAVSPATGAITVERKQKVASDLTIQGKVDVKPTWDSVSSVSAFSIDVTNTQSGSGSTLIDARLGGSSKFSVDKDGNISAAGGLTVQGSVTTINSTDLAVTDKTIQIANGATTTAAISGGGILLGVSPVQKSFLYDTTNSEWDLSDSLSIGGSYKIGTSTVLSSSTLGSSVVNSSLTSVGTLGSLTVSGQTALKSVTEGVEQRTASQSGTQTYDFGLNAIFYHPSLAGNITAAVTNVPVTGSRAHSIAIIFTQGATAYTINNSFGVNGTSITVKWADAEVPVGEPNRVDIFNFTIINVGTDASPSWQVYGSKSFFG
jgi:hypothetical protein